MVFFQKYRGDLMVGGIEGKISEKWRVERQHLREMQHQLDLNNFLPPAIIVEISDIELGKIRGKLINKMSLPRARSRACLFGEHRDCDDGDCGCFCHPRIFHGKVK